MRKTPVIVFLILWFGWSAGKDLDALVRHSITTDYYVLATAGLTWLFFAMGFAVFLLDTAAVFYLFRPQPAGPRVLWAALAAGAVQNVVTVSLMLDDIPAVREAYERGRELRGLPVRDEALDMVFTRPAMLGATGVMLALYAIVALAVWFGRRYFAGHAAMDAEMQA